MLILMYASHAACELGLADQGRAFVQDAFTLAQRLGRPYELAYAEVVAGIAAHSVLSDFQRAAEHACRVEQLATEQQLPVYLALAKMTTGWALAHEGQHGPGVAKLREGLREYVAAGQRTAIGRYLGWLAKAQLMSGAVTEALETLEAALAAAPAELMFMPELLCLRSDLHAAAGADAATVEASYREAAALAHQLGAKLRELQATTSLGRHLRARGRMTEARELLAPLYATFGEGFDTRDLVEAKALLDELT
jgi:predicted ATPase